MKESEMNKNPILKAARFAAACHEGQTRKYTGQPYITHPARVAARVAIRPDVTEAMVCAAFLHDVVEDCDVHPERIAELFGPAVESIVVALTNPSKQHKHLRRAARKEMDREHLMRCPRSVQVIKLLDRIDNIREMTGAEDDFKSLYAHESLALADSLDSADPLLADELRACVRDLVATIGGKP